MSEMTVKLFSDLKLAKDVLQYGFGLTMPIQKDVLRDEVLKAAKTLMDARQYVLENMGVETPTDRHTAIKYDEVTLRRLAQVKDAFEKVAHATGNFERVKKMEEYKDAQNVVNQFRRHIKSQIKKTGG